MADDDAMMEFKEGLELMNVHVPSKALRHFIKAVELDRSNPFYLSYLGVALARAHQKWEEAEDCCHSALRMKRDQPELYLNLAEVYRMAGKKDDAIQTIATGIPLTKKDPRLIKALRKFGVRRAPVLSFLGRSSFLNRHLGRFRYKFLRTIGREARGPLL